MQLKELGIYEKTLIIFTSDNGPTFNVGSDSEWFRSGGPFPVGYGYGKGFLHEGGIRVPMVASWPGVIKPGSVSDHISAFYDVMPTLAELSGAVIPEGICGISFYPALKGENQEKHNYLYWEFPSYGGQMAVMKGNLKAIRKNMHEGNMAWEVFDLEEDPAESTDLSELYPDFTHEVEKIVSKEHIPPQKENWRFKHIP